MMPRIGHKAEKKGGICLMKNKFRDIDIGGTAIYRELIEMNRLSTEIAILSGKRGSDVIGESRRILTLAEKLSNKSGDTIEQCLYMIRNIMISNGKDAVDKLFVSNDLRELV